MSDCTLGPCWTASTLNSNIDIESCAVGEGVWVVGGRDSSTSNSILQYSTDGVSWTPINFGYQGGYSIRSLAYGNNTFVGYINAVAHVVSSDGINWSLENRVSWFGFAERPVQFGGGYFFMLGGTSYNRYLYSSTGTGVWQFGPETPGIGLYANRDLSYGNGIWVTLGSDGFSYTSSLGSSPTLVPFSVGDVKKIAYGNGRFVAVGGADRRSITSTDGINWTTHTGVLPLIIGSNSSWDTITYSQGYFFAATIDNNTLAISLDGITWTLSTSDHSFDSAGGVFQIADDDAGNYIAINNFIPTIAQIGICPCTTPIVYGDYWAKLSNVTAKNISISRVAAPVDPYYNEVVLVSNMSSGSGGAVITNNMVLYVDATNGLTPVIGNTTLSGNAPVVDNYFDFNGFASINIENPNLYNVSWTSGKTILVAAQFNSGFNEPGYRALLGATGEFALLDRIVNLYIEVLNPPPYAESKYRLAFSAGSYGTWSADLNIAPDAWFIFGVTHSPDGTVKFYVNGYQVPNFDPGATQPLTGFNPGSQYLGRADNYWWGKIGYWQVYNTALTSQQVLQNYKATANNFPGGNTLMIDESKYSNPSKIYYAGWEEFQSYLVNTGGPINNGACWKCAYSDTTGFANRIVYYDSIPQFAMPGDFTIEAWIYNAVYSLGEAQYCLTGSTGIDQTVWSIRTSTSGFIFMSDQLKDASNPSADLIVDCPTSAGVWHHVAVVRSGNTVKIYVDGTQSVPQASKNVVPGGSIPECKITALGQMQSGALPHTWMPTGDYLGPFRITVGVARYTGPFTPPTGYFPTQ